MTIEDLQKYKLVVIDKESRFVLSDDEEFFLNDEMQLCIKDVDRNGNVNINIVNPDLYEIKFERDKTDQYIELVNSILGTNYDKHTLIATFSTAIMCALAKVTYNSIICPDTDFPEVKSAEDLTIDKIRLNNNDKQLFKEMYDWAINNKF